VPSNNLGPEEDYFLKESDINELPSSIVAKALIVGHNDTFGINQLVQNTRFGGGEHTEKYSSHSFLMNAFVPSKEERQSEVSKSSLNYSENKNQEARVVKEESEMTEEDTSKQSRRGLTRKGAATVMCDDKAVKEETDIVDRISEGFISVKPAAQSSLEYSNDKKRKAQEVKQETGKLSTRGRKKKEIKM
jgi:hypothetical protein